MSNLFNEMMEEISEKDIKIADLEAKLTESENKVYELQTKLNLKEHAPAFCSLAGRDCEVLGKVDQLKQQLEEEKNRSKKLNHEAQKYYEDAYCNNFQNQKAIAELEKVKTLFKEEFKDKWLEDCGIDYYEWSNYDTAITIIDQQIAQLKGEK